jgi:ketosteroid isomerase-like protein
MLEVVKFVRTAEEVSEAFDAAWAKGDVDAFVGLFAPDATIEGPLVSRLVRTREGVCRGRDEIRAFVHEAMARGAGWGRHEPPVVRGGTIFVEYRGVFDGDEQLDYVDVFEIEGGYVKSLRAYCGWRSVAASASP